MQGERHAILRIHFEDGQYLSVAVEERTTVSQVRLWPASALRVGAL